MYLTLDKLYFLFSIRCGVNADFEFASRQKIR